MQARPRAQDPWLAPDPMLVPVVEGGRFLPLIDRLAYFSGRWQRLKSQVPRQIEELRVVATIESVASSTRIEGAQLTNEEVREILAGVSIDSFRARDEQEVRGYRDLLEFIFAQHETMRISENSLKEFHRVLLAYSEKDAFHRGEYKAGPNHVEKRGDGPPVVVFRTAPPAETRWWMTRLVDEFNAAWDAPDWHRLVLIADFILWFLAIHPFQDGNGRLARALTSLLLLKAGYAYVPYASLEGIVEENKAEYYIALQTSQVATRVDTTHYGEWLTFFLRTLEAQQDVLERRVSEIARRVAMPPARSRILGLITERGPLTSPAVAAAVGLAERTVRYHLARLARDGLLVASRPTAGRLYSLPVEAVSALSVVVPLSGTSAAASTAFGTLELSPLDFDPVFQRHAASSPNGRAYATVVVGSANPNQTPLGDAELDAVEVLAARIAPSALALRATPEVAWWHIEDQPRLDRFQLWLYPGPLVVVHWAMDASDAPDNARLALDPVGLVIYWRHVLSSAARFADDVGVTQCALGLNIQTQPSSRPPIVDFDFSGTTAPVRSGTSEAVPPWRAPIVRVAPAQLSEYHTLKPALDQLLRHFSYRHTAATLELTFDTAHGKWNPNVVPTRLVDHMLQWTVEHQSE